MRVTYEILGQFNPKNTIIIATPFMLGARIANEMHHFPLIQICLQPIGLWSLKQVPRYSASFDFQILPYFLRKMLLKFCCRFMTDKILSGPVNEFRRELGLAKAKDIFSKWLYSPTKIIGLFPRWFCPHSPDWPKNTVLTGFVHYKQKNLNENTLAEIIDFAKQSEPPMVITYGTSNALAAPFFKISIEALRYLKQRVLILTPNKDLVPTLIPNQEIVIEYFPLEQILPYCKGIIHHGGVGTLCLSLFHKIPQLIVPITADQPDNALRVKKLKIGVVIKPKSYNIKNAKKAIQNMLQSEPIKQSIRSLSEKINFSATENEIIQIIKETYKVTAINHQKNINGKKSYRTK